MLASLWATSIDDIEEWFKPIWRDGRNAVRLALAAGGNVETREPADRYPIAWLKSSLFAPTTAEQYDLAESHRYHFSRSSNPADVFFVAAFAIYANWVARSDGGGVVPNIYLADAFWPRLRDGAMEEETALELVGEWRATDLGLNWFDPRGPGYVFQWCWKNRRYRMAMLSVDGPLS